MKRKMNTTERFIMLAIGMMSLLMFIPNLDIEPAWENQMKVQGSLRNIQMEVDSFVAKKAISPTEEGTNPTCSVPQKLAMQQLDSTMTTNGDDSYFLDVHGTVWREDVNQLLTVTKQLDSVVFNHVGASKYEVLSTDLEDCSTFKVLKTIYPTEDNVIQVQINDDGEGILVRPFFGKRTGMPVGDGFDGRKYQ